MKDVNRFGNKIPDLIDLRILRDLRFLYFASNSQNSLHFWHENSNQILGKFEIAQL